ncbi:unnamed protein product [Amoebophrya sp. A25]|nr:unnamed protein product [Amoebophrya sp. A25]|eukprot:GSA25T00011806001.1
MTKKMARMLNWKMFSWVLVGIFTTGWVKIAVGQEACDIFLTPTQIMTGELDSGARVVTYTNLRVTCKRFYRKGGASQVARVDAPLYYRKCSDSNTRYDEASGTCVEMVCPQPCSLWDPHCLASRTDDNFVAANVTQWGSNFAQRAAEVQAQGKAGYEAMRSLIESEKHNFGGYWWAWDPTRYEVAHRGFEWCGHHHDWESDTHDMTQCRCGFVELIRAKDPNNRFEHDWPPHGKSRTDDYYMWRHRDINFPSVPKSAADCLPESVKRDRWMQIFPDFAQPWAAPDKDRWYHHATTTQPSRTEHLRGRNSLQEMTCDALTGHDPHHHDPAYTQTPEEETYWADMRSWCSNWIKENKGPLMFGHRFHHFLSDHQMDRVLPGPSPSGPFNVDADGIRSMCAERHDMLELWMVYNGVWTPSVTDHTLYDIDYGQKMNEPGGFSDWCVAKLSELYGRIAGLPRQVDQQHGQKTPGAVSWRATQAGVLNTMRDILDNAYVKKANGEIGARHDPFNDHGSEVMLPIKDGNAVNNHPRGHLFPKLKLPPKFGSPCFSYVEYAETIQNYQQREHEGFPGIIKPEWKCTDGVSITENIIKFAPPTDDAAHTMLRFLSRKSVETQLDILESVDIKAGRVNIFILDQSETGGQTRKEGPSLAELRQSCSVRLNMYFDSEGRQSVAANSWIPLGNLTQAPANCDADGVRSAQIEFDETLRSLTSATDVKCNATAAHHYRRALQEVAANEKGIRRRVAQSSAAVFEEETALTAPKTLGDHFCDEMWTETMQKAAFNPEHPGKETRFQLTVGERGQQRSAYLADCHKRFLSGIVSPEILEAKALSVGAKKAFEQAEAKYADQMHMLPAEVTDSVNIKLLKNYKNQAQEKGRLSKTSGEEREMSAASGKGFRRKNFRDTTRWSSLMRLEAERSKRALHQRAGAFGRMLKKSKQKTQPQRRRQSKRGSGDLAVNSRTKASGVTAGAARRGLQEGCRGVSMFGAGAVSECQDFAEAVIQYVADGDANAAEYMKAVLPNTADALRAEDGDAAKAQCSCSTFPCPEPAPPTKAYCERKMDDWAGGVPETAVDAWLLALQEQIDMQAAAGPPPERGIEPSEDEMAAARGFYDSVLIPCHGHLIAKIKTEATAAAYTATGADIDECLHELIADYSATLVVGGISKYESSAPATEGCKRFLETWNDDESSSMCKLRQVISDALRSFAPDPVLGIQGTQQDTLQCCEYARFMEASFVMVRHKFALCPRVVADSTYDFQVLHNMTALCRAPEASAAHDPYALAQPNEFCFAGSRLRSFGEGFAESRDLLPQMASKTCAVTAIGLARDNLGIDALAATPIIASSKQIWDDIGGDACLCNSHMCADADRSILTAFADKACRTNSAQPFGYPELCHAKCNFCGSFDTRSESAPSAFEAAHSAGLDSVPAKLLRIGGCRERTIGLVTGNATIAKAPVGGCSDAQFCEAWTEYGTQLASGAASSLMNQHQRCFCDLHCSKLAKGVTAGSPYIGVLESICGSFAASTSTVCDAAGPCGTTYKPARLLPPPDVVYASDRAADDGGRGGDEEYSHDFSQDTRHPACKSFGQFFWKLQQHCPAGVPKTAKQQYLLRDPARSAAVPDPATHCPEEEDFCALIESEGANVLDGGATLAQVYQPAGMDYILNDPSTECGWLCWDFCDGMLTHAMSTYSRMFGRCGTSASRRASFKSVTDYVCSRCANDPNSGSNSNGYRAREWDRMLIFVASGARAQFEGPGMATVTLNSTEEWHMMDTHPIESCWRSMLNPWHGHQESFSHIPGYRCTEQSACASISRAYATFPGVWNMWPARIAATGQATTPPPQAGSGCDGLKSDLVAHTTCVSMATQAFDAQVLGLVKRTFTDPAKHDKLTRKDCAPEAASGAAAVPTAAESSTVAETTTVALDAECFNTYDECGDMYNVCVAAEKNGGTPCIDSGSMMDAASFQEGCDKFFSQLQLVPAGQQRATLISRLLEQFDMGRPSEDQGGGDEHHDHYDEDAVIEWHMGCEVKCKGWFHEFSGGFEAACRAEDKARVQAFEAYCMNSCPDFLPPSCGERLENIFRGDRRADCYEALTGFSAQHHERPVKGFCGIKSPQLLYNDKTKEACRADVNDPSTDPVCTSVVPLLSNVCSAANTNDAAFGEYAIKRAAYEHESINDEGHRRWMRRKHMPDLCCHIGNVTALSEYCNDASIVSTYMAACPFNCTRGLQESRVVTQTTDPGAYAAELAKQKADFDREITWGWRHMHDQFWPSPMYSIYADDVCEDCHDSCHRCKSDLNEEVCRLRCEERFCGHGGEKWQWMLYEGMNCNRKNEILEQMSQSRMTRSFIFTAREVITGCTHHLRNWLVYEDQPQSFTTSECEEEDYVCPDREWWNCRPNRAFFRDPCCNHELRRFQCCAPRVLSFTRRVPTKVHANRVGGYVYAKHKQEDQEQRRLRGRMLFMSKSEREAVIDQKKAAMRRHLKQQEAAPTKVERAASPPAVYTGSGALDASSTDVDARKDAPSTLKTANKHRVLQISDLQLAQLTNVALAAVNTYVEQETLAARSCFASFDNFMKSVTKDDLMHTCWNAVHGEWNDYAGTSFGDVCSSNNDCYTGSCVTVPSDSSSGGSGGGSSATSTDRCATPLDLPGKDFIIPVLRCLFRLGVASGEEQRAVKSIFLRDMLELTPVAGQGINSITDAQIRARAIQKYAQNDTSASSTPGMHVAHYEAPIESKCMGNHEAHNKKTEATCVAQKTCNWFSEAPSGIGCTNPCHAGLSDTSNITSCGNYCKNPTVRGKERNDVSIFPTCYSAITARSDEQLRSTYHQCHETRHRASEQCRQHCDTCRHHDQDTKMEDCRREIRTANGWHEHEHVEWDLVWDCLNTKCTYQYTMPGTTTTVGIHCDRCWEENEWLTAGYDCMGQVLARCKQLDPEVDQIEKSGWDNFRCKIGAKSYSADKQTACEGVTGCQSATGPQPAPASQCFGVLKPKHASHETCHSLAEGHVEPVYPASNPLEMFHSGRHYDKPPKYCHIKSYQAEVLVGGTYKPFLRPPPFGFTCPQYCENFVHKRRHCDWKVQESCRDNFRDLKNLRVFVGTRGSDSEAKTDQNSRRLEDLFNECTWRDCSQITGCTRHYEKRRLCAQEILQTYKDQVSNGEAHPFEDSDCFSCHEWEWIEWDDFRIRIFKHPELPDECRWQEGPTVPGNFSQPCAEECHHYECEESFRMCQFLNPSMTKMACQTQVREMNQCRQCTFIRCDERCKNECNDVDHFHGWTEPSEACSGCDSTQAATFKCNPTATCYEDRACWGEAPRFAGGCSRACEEFVEKCRHDKMSPCWNQKTLAGDTEGKWAHDSLEHHCHQAWHQTPMSRVFHELRDSYARHDYNVPIAWPDRYWEAKDSVRAQLSRSVVQEYWALFAEPNKDTQVPEFSFCGNHGPMKFSQAACNEHPCCMWDGHYWEHNKCTQRKGVTLGTCREKIVKLVDMVGREGYPLGEAFKGFNPSNGQCWLCHGEWNGHMPIDAPTPWSGVETAHSQCLADASAKSSACSVCEVGCDRDCEYEMRQDMDCRHAEITGLPSGHSRWHKLCRKSYTAAETALRASRTGCSTCQMLRCEHECSKPCGEVHSWNWQEHVRACGRCVQGSFIPRTKILPQCYPGANCWAGDEMVWDGVTWPTTLPVRNACFPAHSHSRQLAELEENSPERLATLEAKELDNLDIEDHVEQGTDFDIDSEEEANEVAKNLDSLASRPLGISDRKAYFSIKSEFEHLRRLSRDLDEELSFHEWLLRSLSKKASELYRAKEPLYAKAAQAVQRRLSQNKFPGTSAKSSKKLMQKTGNGRKNNKDLVKHALASTIMDEKKPIGRFLMTDPTVQSLQGHRPAGFGRSLLQTLADKKQHERSGRERQYYFYHQLLPSAQKSEMIGLVVSSSSNAATKTSLKAGAAEAADGAAMRRLLQKADSSELLHGPSLLRRVLTSEADRAALDKANKELLEVLLIRNEILSSRELNALEEDLERRRLVRHEGAEILRVIEELDVRAGVDPFKTIGGAMFSRKGNRVLQAKADYAALKVEQSSVQRRLDVDLKRRALAADKNLRRCVRARAMLRRRALASSAPSLLSSSKMFLNSKNAAGGRADVLDTTEADLLAAFDLETDLFPLSMDDRVVLPSTAGGEADADAKTGKGRALQVVGELIRKDLECSTGSCAAQSEMCTKFFVRTDATKHKVDAVIDSWSWGAAPWEDADKICDMYEGRCYITKSQMKTLFVASNRTDLFGHDCWWHTHHNGGQCNEDCSGCSTGDRSKCGHCCQCNFMPVEHITQAAETRDGKQWYCWKMMELFRDQRDRLGQQIYGLNEHNRMRRHWHHHAHESDEIWMHFEWDSKLKNGEGGCIQHDADWVYDINLPAQCYPPSNHDWSNYDHAYCSGLRMRDSRQCFYLWDVDGNQTRMGYYAKERDWNSGMLATQSDCEAESCYPDFWITDQTSCNDLSYCRDGGCKKCRSHDWHDRSKTQERQVCVAKGRVCTPGATAADPETCEENARIETPTTCATIGGQFVALDRTGQRGVCVMTPPAGTGGGNVGAQCATLMAASTAITYNTSSYTAQNATAPTFYYDTLDCAAFSPRDCEQASRSAALQTMGCHLEHWAECETREECDSSGECEAHFDEGWDLMHMAGHEDGGFCTLPLPYALEDFPIGWHHDPHMHMPGGDEDGTTETTTSTESPWKIDIHNWDDRRRRLCQRIAPIGYVTAASEWGCLVVMATVDNPSAPIPPGASSVDIAAEFAVKQLAQASNYFSGSMPSHSWNATAFNYFLSSGYEQQHSSWPHPRKYRLPFNEEITLRPRSGMTAGNCTLIGGKWIERAFDRAGCQMAGALFGAKSSGGISGVTQDWLETYTRNVTQRTSVLGETTPAPVVIDTSGATTTAAPAPMMGTATAGASNGDNIALVARPVDAKVLAAAASGVSLYDEGTFACCAEYSMWGSQIHCHQWSKDDKATCESCGNRWMSVSRWNSWSQWIRNTWTSVYTWQMRVEGSQNNWVLVPNEWRFWEMFQNVITEATFHPQRNFIRCRGSPSLACLEGLTNATKPQVKLGNVEFGDTAVTKMGDYDLTLKTSSSSGSAATTTRQLEVEESMIFSEDEERPRLLTTQAAQTADSPALSISVKTAKSVAVDAYIAPQGSTGGTQSGSTSGGNVFGTGCFSVVKEATRVIGQLVGDCLSFSLPGTGSSAQANVCLTMSTEILQQSLNSDFGQYDFGQLVTPTTAGSVPFVAPSQTSVVETISSNGVKRICGDISLSASATFCPIKRLANYQQTTDSASSTCSNIAELQALVKTEVDTRASSTSSNFDMFGNPIVQEFGGSSFGSSASMITNIADFEAGVTATSAAGTGSSGSTAVSTSSAVLGGFGSGGASGSGANADSASLSADIAALQSGAAVEKVYVKSALNVAAKVSPNCDSSEKVMSTEPECVAFRTALTQGIIDGLTAVSAGAGNNAVEITGIAFLASSRRLQSSDTETRDVRLTGASSGGSSRRRLSGSDAQLDVKYKVEVADVTAGNAIAATLTTAKASFETAMATGMATAIANDATLQASGAFQVTGVTSKPVVVETEIVYFYGLQLRLADFHLPHTLLAGFSCTLLIFFAFPEVVKNAKIFKKVHQRK